MGASSDSVDGRSLRYQHRRSDVLTSVTEHVLEYGVSDLSLRAVARSVGVSHATLLRHFGSKDGLLAAVLDRIRTDVAAGVSRVVAGGRQQRPADDVRSMWQALCEPAAQRQFRVLFELVGRPGSADFSQGLESLIVSSWTELIVQRLVLDGWSPVDAQPVATLLLAQFRGLQLDLMVTGDRRRVDQAIELSLGLLDPPDGHVPPSPS
jgi:AcrR family transcriptional regulator